MFQQTDQYLWYSTEAGGTQEDGFFVEKTGRILFWPDNLPTVYSLSPDVAERIRKIGARIEVIDFVIGILFVLGAFSLHFFAPRPSHDQTSQDWFLELTHKTLSSGAALVASVFLAFIVLYFLRRAVKKRAIRQILKSCSFVEKKRRPKAEHLKGSFSVLHKLRAISSLTIAVLEAAKILAVVGLICINLLSPYLGNSIVAGAVGAFVVVFNAIEYFREETGLRPDQVKVFGGSKALD